MRLLAHCRRAARGRVAAGVLTAALAACGGAGTSVGEGITAYDGSTSAGDTTGGTTGDDGTTDGGTGGGSGSTSTTTTTGGMCTADTYANFAAAFFTTNCVSCHSHDHSLYSTYAGVAGDAAIPSQIKQGSMPLGATLSASDKSRILAWFTCNLPQ